MRHHPFRQAKNSLRQPCATPASDITVRADVEIPDRKFKMTMLFQRNTDPKLSASHTVDLNFDFPPDFQGGGVSRLVGIMMKSSETVRGMALDGAAIKVNDRNFLAALSNTDKGPSHNLQLLKERSWFDFAIVFADQHQAVITIEKCAPGQRAFDEALAAWGEPADTKDALHPILKKESASPIPPPSQPAAPTGSAFPPISGSAPASGVGAAIGAEANPSADCMKDFVPLGEEAERSGKEIEAAIARHASPAEACQLFGSLREARVKVINYVEANAARCKIPAELSEQLKIGHKKIEEVQQKACKVARETEMLEPASPSLSDILGSSSAPKDAN